MKNAAAFQASYTDWRVIKGRKVVSVSFEVPIEHADLAYQALGGMPNPASEVWCGIARIQTSSPSAGPAGDGAKPGRPAPVEESRATKRAWNDMLPQTQAAIIGAEPAFWKYATETFQWGECCDENDAREFILDWCAVPYEEGRPRSRKYLETDHRSRTLWHGLVNQYWTWRDHPELVEE